MRLAELMSAEEETLEALSARYAACQNNSADFYDKVLDRMRPEEDGEGLSPELALAVMEGATLAKLIEAGWDRVWSKLCVWLPADPRPGGSWRLRAARAAAARRGEPDFGDEFGAHARHEDEMLDRDPPRPLDRTPTWTGFFLSPWAPEGEPHLDEFDPREQRAFLALAPKERLAYSLEAWIEETRLDDEVSEWLGLDHEKVSRRRLCLLDAAWDALAQGG